MPENPQSLPCLKPPAWANKAFHPLRLGLLVALILGAVANPALPASSVTHEGGAEVHFFFHPSCPHCHEQMVFNKALEEKYGIRVVSHDVTTPNGSALFKKMAADAGFEPTGVPATFVGKDHFIGFDAETGRLIEQAVMGTLSGRETVQAVDGPSTIVDLPFLGEVDVKQYSLPLLAIVLGLIDGCNPCATWVLVYLLGLLMGVGDRKRVWVVVGSFLLASGALYFVFMAAWLNVFLVVGHVRAITVIVGLAAIWFGARSLLGYFRGEGVSCEVTSSGSRERTMRRADRLVNAPLTVTTLLGIVALAFIVNSVEFVCSSALPAVFTQVLALTGLKALEYYLYILLYCFFFMLDDLFIFGLAALAIGSSFGEKYARQSKLLGGILLVILGLVLTFAPQALR